MPYPQDMEGLYIAYRVDPGGTLSTGMTSQMVNGVLPGQITAAHCAIYSDTAQPTLGQHRTAARPPAMLGHHRSPPPGALQFHPTWQSWSFTFLKYYAGAVTTAPLAGGVMTGPMSGCYLCTYLQGGQRHLAHIGTANAPDSDESIAVKTAWNSFVGRADVSGVVGGSPFDYFTTGEYQQAMINPGGGIPLICGFFAADGSAYALLLAPVPNAMRPPTALLKVAKVKRMTLQPWSSIAAMRRFR